MPVFLAVLLGIAAGILHAIEPKLALIGLGIFCGLLLGMLQSQLKRIDRLKTAVDQLGQRVVMLARRIEPDPAPTAITPATALSTPALEPTSTGEQATITPPPTAQPPSAAVSAPAFAIPSAGPRPADGMAPKESGSLPGPLRWLLAGNPVAKIGVLLLFFGLAYLFKYASDHAMLPIELRLGGAVILAGGLLATGWRLRLKQELYGLLLQGAAIGSLYLIIFAAYRLYGLLPQPLAFGLMLVVCAASVALAVLQKAQGLAMAASLGGFMAPLLMSTGQGNHISLFSYYLMLSSGILAVSLFQSWRSLNVIGFFFTFSVGGYWGINNYVPAMYPECQAFLIAFLLIYGVIALLFAFRQPTTLRGFVDGTLVFGSPLVGFGLQYGLTRHWEFGPAFSALAFAAFYLPIAAWLLKKRPHHGRLLAQAFFSLGLCFVTLAIPLGLDASWTALAWVLEGAGLLWVGSVQAQRRMVWSGVALQMAAAIAWLLFLFDGPSLIAGAACGLILALAWLCGGLVLSRPGRTLKESTVLSLILLGGGLLWWMITIPWALEHAQFGSPAELQETLYLLLMSGSALLWHIGGRKLQWPALGHASWLLWLVFLLCTTVTHGLQGWNWVSWPLALIAALWLLRQRKDETPELLLSALHASWLWLLAGLLIHEALQRLETHLLFVQEWAALAWLALPAALTGLVVFGVRRKHWPFVPQTFAWLGLASAPLLLMLALGLLFANLEDGKVRALDAYVPLLNPLELSAAAALLALLAWQRQAVRSWSLLQVSSAQRMAVLGGLAFWWGNGLLLRLLSEYGSVDWSADSLWQSRLVQTSMALAWTICAMVLMWKAARKGWRLVWVIGAALLAVVVAKLMLVDSASGGGLARAVAFIGVALLLLLIGYVAPLPPRLTAGEEHV